jgi:two-component system, NtrC family, sensor kinase
MQPAPLAGRPTGVQAMRGGVAVLLHAPSLVASMALAILIVATVAFWDEERESTAALDDFAHEQAIVATSLSAALESRLEAMQRDARAAAVDDGTDADVASRALLGSIAPVEIPGSLLLLVQRPHRPGLLTTGGALVRAPRIEAALEFEGTSLRLSRGEAAELGLPRRMAMAGLGRFDLGALGRWGVAVVATAKRERDRELRARWRLVLSVVVASGLVLAFGGLALRKQRKELALQHDLAIAEVERQRDERLVQADKLATMGALATGIAHEVSTPLGVIAGRAEQLLPRVENDPKAKHAVDAIVGQVERISQIVRGFLSLARGDSPPLERVDPEAIARASVDLVEHRFAKGGVHLSSDIEPRLRKIACEPRLFEQVIVNLLLNACDACAPGGSVELRVRGDCDRVAFIVTDDGVGVTPDAAARATEPFFTTKPFGKGSGLGLAIASEIVKHHNGHLTIRARADEGKPTQGSESTASPAQRGTRACVDVPASP